MVTLTKKKKKKRIPKKKLMFFSAIAIVFIVLVTGLVMVFTKGKELSDTIIEMPFSTDTVSADVLSATPFSSGQQYFGIGQNIVYVDGELLTCIDTNLKIIWQLKLFSSGLKFTSNNEIIAATGHGVIQAVNTRAQHLFTTKLDGEIDSARLGRDKIAVYVQRPLDETTQAYIVIFNLNGTSLFQIDVTQRYVLDYGFDAESSALYILELDVSGSVPVSRISTYRPETQSMTGIKELKDQLVSRLHITGDQLYAIGTNRLTVYKSLSADTRSIMVYGWVLKDICFQPDPCFVFVPAGSKDEISIARVIRGSGSEITINLPPGVFDIVHTSDRIYCFANDRIFVYTVEGKYTRTYALPSEINSVERALEKHVFITQGNKVYLLPLP